MAPFCDTSLMPGEAQYELFSVVIHRGSTHSGHYTAFIRDVDDLGVWQVKDHVLVGRRGMSVCGCARM